MDRLKNIFRQGRADDEAPHACVAAADPYSFAVAHRRLAWMLRLSVALNVVLAASQTVTINAISALVPLKKTEIALVRTDPSDDRIYRIEPISKNVEGFDILMESMARRYVRLLLEIDPVTQTERFREAFRMTDRAFYERFKRDRIDSKKVQEAIADGITRSITVESVDRIASYYGTYKYAVDLVQVDTKDGREIDRKRTRAYLEMTTREQKEVPEADRYENPLGITVLNLVLKERANS